MQDSFYALGFDFGTLSCRGVLIDLKNGELKSSATSAYKHGVISRCLEDSQTQLPIDWHLQDPQDWIDSMAQVCHTILSESEVSPKQILSLGTDFTNCTVVPCTATGTPICQLDRFKNRPHAWPKLWKHHSAQKYAEEIERFARENTTWLKKYFGNSVSSEWLFPKVLQVLREDPEIYSYADLFIEAVDYIVLYLTGRITRNIGLLGLNSFWTEEHGFPSQDFCKALDPRMQNIVQDKLQGDLLEVGDYAGHLTEAAAATLGLSPHTVVASGHGDSEVTACGIGANEVGSTILVMGTSTCHQMLSDQLISFEGLCSVTKGGMLPHLYSYEAGQPATGDVFSWFEQLCAGGSYETIAKNCGMSLLEYLGKQAENLAPGASGLLALDWLAGNRSVLLDYNLSGAIIGLNLHTRVEEIYRALVEANIFGSKKILENFESHGLTIKKLYAVGGIVEKAPWIMQLCADILGKSIHAPTFGHVSARGAAVCGSVALGHFDPERGFSTFSEACKTLIPRKMRLYEPNLERTEEYAELYSLYSEMHDIMGCQNSIMRKLRNIRQRKMFEEET